jgi:peroxiredoxin Q/BCP
MTATLHQPAPDFNLEATNNTKIKLSDLQGKNIVLYFYPKDCTSGCTLEGQNFRDLQQQFAKFSTIIFGISRDKLKLHERFKQEQNFSFELISDPDEVACKLYDVVKDKTMYGKKVRGIERSTFLIDAKGILRHEWRKVKVDGHAQEVLEVVKAL